MRKIAKAQRGSKVSGQGWKCSPSGCSGAATGKWKGDRGSGKAYTGSGRLSKDDRKRLKHEEEQEKIYGPDNLIRSPRSEFRQYPMNWKGRSSTKSTTSSSAKHGKTIKKARNGASTPAWQRSEGKDPKGGLNKKGVASYRAANPGSKLQTAVTTKPSKLKPGSKSANRRKSFCARMEGHKRKNTSAKTANDPNSRINKSLRKWNC